MHVGLMNGPSCELHLVTADHVDRQFTSYRCQRPRDREYDVATLSPSKAADNKNVGLGLPFASRGIKLLTYTISNDRYPCWIYAKQFDESYLREFGNCKKEIDVTFKFLKQWPPTDRETTMPKCA